MLLALGILASTMFTDFANVSSIDSVFALSIMLVGFATICAKRLLLRIFGDAGAAIFKQAGIMIISACTLLLIFVLISLIGFSGSALHYVNGTRPGSTVGILLWFFIIVSIVASIIAIFFALILYATAVCCIFRLCIAHEKAVWIIILIAAVLFCISSFLGISYTEIVRAIIP